MVEVVGVVVVDDLDRCGVAHVLVEFLAFPDPGDRSGVDLIGVVAADAAAVVSDSARVGLAGREQEDAVVLEGEGRRDDDVGGLEVLAPLCVDVGDARGEAVRVGLDPECLGVRSYLIAVGGECDREMGVEWAGLCVDLASEPRAEAAVEAAAPVVAERVCPGARGDSRGLGERVEPEALGRCGELLAERRDRQRRVRVAAASAATRTGCRPG